jgi:hypothetical protein
VTKQISRQREWQLRKRAEGKCESCGKDRGSNGTKRHCRKHANEHSARNVEYQRKAAQQ